MERFDTDMSVEPGEEIVVTYGQHGNDFLLLECESD